MKVIALLGKSDTGKSHVINIVYSFLLRDGYTQVPGHFITLGNPKFNDISDILVKEKIKVGFVGMGDYERGVSRLSKLISDLESEDCDFVICACRDREGIIKEIKKFKDHTFVKKTTSTEDSQNRIVNAIDADRMIAFI